MQPPDTRDPNAAAHGDWPGETRTGRLPQENPTLPRMTPIPSPSGAPAGPHARPGAQPARQGYPVAGLPRTRATSASPINVNVAAVPTGAWLAAAGGLAVLIGSFLPWITLSTTGANGRVQSYSQSGWDLSAFGRVTALIGLLALALFVVRLLNVSVPVRLPWSDHNSYMALGVEALLLSVLYLIDNAHSAQNVRGLSIGPAFGLFLTVLGAIAVTVGAYLLDRPAPAAHPTPPTR